MPLSLDLRKRIIAAVDAKMHIDEAAVVFKVSRRVIYKWLELRKKTGSLQPIVKYQNGHSHTIKDWDQFKIFVKNHQQSSGPKMIFEWKKLTGVEMSERVIYKALKKIGYTSKKTFNYIEASQIKRALFLEEIKNLNPADLVYSDETGIDDNETVVTGWSLRGKRCYAYKKAERKKRYNITAALNLNLLFAPFLFEGYSNTAVYETYVEHVLVPALRPGMVVIIDNASFHKSKKIIELIEAAECKVIFLPPYSPDFNPIEHHWTAIKHAIRKAAEITQDFYEAAVTALGNMCTT